MPSGFDADCMFGGMPVGSALVPGGNNVGRQGVLDGDSIGRWRLWTQVE